VKPPVFPGFFAHSLSHKFSLRLAYRKRPNLTVFTQCG
jgi:hypothetical protein